MKTCGGCPDCGYIRCRCDLPLLVGNSLSQCIKELLEGKVYIEQVVCIISGTKIMNGHDRELWLDAECKFTLRKFSRDAVDTMLEVLWPRVVQPRKYDFDCNKAGHALWSPAPINS